MNDVAAAIGLAQLDKLPGFLLRRKEIAAIYDAKLSSVPWLNAARETSGPSGTLLLLDPDAN